MKDLHLHGRDRGAHRDTSHTTLSKSVEILGAVGDLGFLIQFLFGCLDVAAPIVQSEHFHTHSMETYATFYRTKFVIYMRAT